MLNEKMVKTLFAIVTPPILVKCSAHSQLLGPSNLRSNINNNAVRLEWDISDPDSTITFNIYRAIIPIYDNPEKLQKINFFKINSISKTNYIDRIEDQNNNNMFIYYVTAVFKEGLESCPSNYVKVIQDGLRMELLDNNINY